MGASSCGLFGKCRGIVVYNAQHESLTKSWVEGFTKETGIKVTLRNGDDTEMGNQLVQEGDKSPADVFLTENSPAMVLVDNAKLFAPVAPTTLEQVGAAYRPAHGNWVGIAARSTVFVYNKDKLSPAQLPKSLLDLAKPEWKGRWAASPAGADFQAIVAAVLELKGEAATLDWLKAMKANASIYRGNSAVLKAVNAGQVESGVIYHYYSFGLATRPRPAKTARTPRCTTSSTRIQVPSSASPVAAYSSPANIRKKPRRSSSGSPAKAARRFCATAIRSSTRSASVPSPTRSWCHSRTSTHQRSMLLSSTARRPWH